MAELRLSSMSMLGVSYVQSLYLDWASPLPLSAKYLLRQALSSLLLLSGSGSFFCSVNSKFIRCCSLILLQLLSQALLLRKDLLTSSGLARSEKLEYLSSLGEEVALLVYLCLALMVAVSLKASLLVASSLYLGEGWSVFLEYLLRMASQLSTGSSQVDCACFSQKGRQAVFELALVLLFSSLSLACSQFLIAFRVILLLSSCDLIQTLPQEVLAFPCLEKSGSKLLGLLSLVGTREAFLYQLGSSLGSQIELDLAKSKASLKFSSLPLLLLGQLLTFSYFLLMPVTLSSVAALAQVSYCEEW